jgi:hypothetical protein
MTSALQICKAALEEIRSYASGYGFHIIEAKARAALEAAAKVPIEATPVEVWNKAIETMRGHFGKFCDDLKLDETKTIDAYQRGAR